MRLYRRWVGATLFFILSRGYHAPACLLWAFSLNDLIQVANSKVSTIDCGKIL